MQMAAMAQQINENEYQMDFDEVLNQEIGQIGQFQIINIVLLAIPAIASGFMAGDYIFTASKIPLRCAIPECDHANPVYDPPWISNVTASTSTGFEECFRYPNITELEEPITGNQCPAYLFDDNKTIPCESYVYGRTNSVVYDFNLECKEWLRALAGTLNSFGAMFALPLAGFISDYFGRKISIVFFGFNVALVGLLRSFSVNYAMYASLQFFHTALGGGLYSACYILATELVGPQYRVTTSASVSSMFALGQVLLGFIAAAIQPWRTLSRVLFAPVFILISYYWLISESHRWLITKNKQQKAREVLKKAARYNGRRISESKLNFLVTAFSEQENVNKKQMNEGSLFKRVVKSPILLRRCLTTPVWWITTTFVYYGLSINSVSLSGNMYFNYIAVSAIEIPGYWTAVLVLDKAGRKATLFTSYTLCGICCIVFAFVSNRNYVLSLILFLVGKFSIAVVMTSLYLYTSELYPTKYRHSFLAFSSTLGRIGSIVAPLTPPLMDYWSGIPSLMFGGMAILSAALVLTQPETIGRKLPDTIEDAENIKSVE